MTRPLCVRFSDVSDWSDEGCLPDGSASPSRRSRAGGSLAARAYAPWSRSSVRSSAIELPPSTTTH